MARPISDEELQLKKRARRRLVGAIVLVSAVAVLLPMVLDSEPKSANQNVDIQIPATDAGQFKPQSAAPVANPQSSAAVPGAVPQTDMASSTTKTEPRSAVATAPSVKTSETPTTAIVESSPKVPAAEPAQPPKPMADSPKADVDVQPGAPVKDKPKTAAKDQPKTSVNGAYVVQVAALADAARVKQLQKQMKGAGIKTYTEVVSTKSGEVTRVRAGPYPTREAAEKARTQLKKAGLDGKVVPR